MSSVYDQIPIDIPKCISVSEWVFVRIYFEIALKKKNKLKRYIYTSLISILCSYRICNRLTTQLSLRWSHIIRDHKYIHINTHTQTKIHIYIHQFFDWGSLPQFSLYAVCFESHKGQLKCCYMLEILWYFCIFT